LKNFIKIHCRKAFDLLKIHFNISSDASKIIKIVGN